MFKFILKALQIRKLLKSGKHYFVGTNCLFCELDIAEDFNGENDLYCKGGINKDLRNRRISMHLKGLLVDKPEDSLFIRLGIRLKKKMMVSLWELCKRWLLRQIIR